MEKLEVSGEASGRSASAKLEEIATSSYSANPPGTVVAGASALFGTTVAKNPEESSSESDNGMPAASGESSAGEFVAKDASKADSSVSSNSSQNEEPNNDDSSGNSKPKKKKPKLDRSKLRKGKWSVEEEEYTSRIIHYFNTGLLTLPEGATLRSYLADKLNCDPMRVTKKYAGASCLGRRVYHFRDRIHPTISEIQLAKQELDHLEHRFRMRIERGHASPPPLPPALPPAVAPSHNMMPTATGSSMPQPPQLQSAAAFQQLLLNLTAAQSNPKPLSATSQPQAAAPAAPWVQPSAAPPSSPVAAAPSAPPKSVPAVGSVESMLQMLLSNTSQTAAGSAPQAHAAGAPPEVPGVNPAVANWAFAQAAVSLGPLLSQLTAANIQQVQRQLESEQKKAQLQAQIQEQQSKMLVQQLLQLQQQQQQQAAPAPPPQPAPSQVNNNSDNDMFARQLKQAYDSILLQQGAQQQQQGKQPAVNNVLATAPSDLMATSNHHARPINKPAQLQMNGQASTGAAAPSAASDISRTAQDKAGGSDLMGFLNTLRQSYEDALREKPSAPDNRRGIQNINWLAEVAAKASSSGGKSDSSSDDANPRHPMVTDSASSQQLESSVEDSEEWTSKKTDLSSSSEGGDSDKEVVDRKRIAKERSQGPPRKRHKIQAQAEDQVRN